MDSHDILDRIPGNARAPEAMMPGVSAVLAKGAAAWAGSLRPDKPGNTRKINSPILTRRKIFLFLIFPILFRKVSK
jgi:hypothetical protein